MRSYRHLLTDALFTMGTIIVVFLVNLFLVELYATKTMTPMIFVLGVFLVSWRTQGSVRWSAAVRYTICTTAPKPSTSVPVPSAAGSPDCRWLWPMARWVRKPWVM